MDRSRWWAPRRASWWIAVLFIIGSARFAIAPFPGFVQLVGAASRYVCSEHVFGGGSRPWR